MLTADAEISKEIEQFEAFKRSEWACSRGLLEPILDDFLGREGLILSNKKKANNQFVTLHVRDITDADAIGGNPIYNGGKLVGRATSGGYGFRVGFSIALAMVNPEQAAIGTMLEIDILGKKYGAEVIEESPFDPKNARIRA